MNSLSNGNCSGTAGAAANCRGICPPGYIQCTSPDIDFHPAPGQALLQCGSANNPLINSVPTTPVYVASVDIDTTCLCFPHVKIEFSTLLSLSGVTAGTSSITVQLIRTCGNRQLPTVLETLTVTSPVGAAGAGTGTLPFNFIYCSQNAPSRECTYTVQVTTAVGPGSAQFTNTAIAAFAVGQQRLC